MSNFDGSRVLTSRKDSAVDNCIVRRRIAADGTRFTTYEVTEEQAALLFNTPGGLKRRDTVVNADNTARVKELLADGANRAQIQEALGVSAGTVRRLLATAGVSQRKYRRMLTDDNVRLAIKVTGGYDISKKSQIVAASKSIGTNSRGLRRLIQRGLQTLDQATIAALRTEGATEAAARATAAKAQEAAAAGQAELPAVQPVAEALVVAEIVNVSAVTSPALPDPAPDMPRFDETQYLSEMAPAEAAAVNDALSEMATLMDAAEAQAPATGVNGLTEAETATTASVAGLMTA